MVTRSVARSLYDSWASCSTSYMANKDSIIRSIMLQSINSWVSWPSYIITMLISVIQYIGHICCLAVNWKHVLYKHYSYQAISLTTFHCQLQTPTWCNKNESMALTVRLRYSFYQRHTATELECLDQSLLWITVTFNWSSATKSKCVNDI